jgi:hypothetical protein
MTPNQHRTRDRQTRLLPQTHCSEVNYSLFIMVVVLVMLERLEKRPGTAPAVFPPPIFVGSALFRGFVFLCRLLAKTPCGEGVFI